MELVKIRETFTFKESTNRKAKELLTETEVNRNLKLCGNIDASAYIYILAGKLIILVPN